MLVIFRGLPGTGKTRLARRLLDRRPDLIVLSRDSLRSGMFAHPMFSEEEKTLVDGLIVAMSDYLLGRGRSVVIDGMALSSSRLLEKFARTAAAHHKEVRIIECICSEATALARIAADEGKHPAGDRGADLYYRVRERFEPTELPLLSIDTDGDEQQNLEAILGYIENPPV
jgi:predicted kinase